MKIFRKIVLDAATGRVLEADPREHGGEVLFCGGGKGGGSTSSTTNISSEPDKEYNARMASVAEQQIAMANEYFNWWQQKQAPVEEATLQSQAELLPLQTQVSKEGLQGLQGVQQNFYALAKPKSSTLSAGQAVTDVNRAMSTAQGTMNRDMSRLGINPASGASLAGMRNMALQNAALKVGAANTARQGVEDMNFKNLATAMQFGQQ
ncbi:MAG: hypothetical protein LBP61_09635 [Desulfovibrio sp.]|jgi:hypothetical protein|nr:hypothetical protein [Desulfovibrio sp.]